MSASPRRETSAGTDIAPCRLAPCTDMAPCRLSPCTAATLPARALAIRNSWLLGPGQLPPQRTWIPAAILPLARVAATPLVHRRHLRKYEVTDVIAAAAGNANANKAEWITQCRSVCLSASVRSLRAVAQLALAQQNWPLDEPLRVRMAIHTGDAELGDSKSPALRQRHAVFYALVAERPQSELTRRGPPGHHLPGRTSWGAFRRSTTVCGRCSPAGWIPADRRRL
jgi:hypothetical protein